jgi:hypothetical protein
MTAPRPRLKPARASLFGGIAVGIASLVLCLAAAHELGFHGLPALAAGVLVSAAAATWTRLADL